MPGQSRLAAHEPPNLLTFNSLPSRPFPHSPCLPFLFADNALIFHPSTFTILRDCLIEWGSVKLPSLDKEGPGAVR